MANVFNGDFYGRCTGCSCCLNVCPNNAISLKLSNDFFLYPYIDEKKCINCKLCAKLCPVLNVNRTNIVPTLVHSVQCKSEIRKQSSSGGVFGTIAKNILNAGGSVCGAAFDSKFQLKHVLINKLDELPTLYKSKYVQSFIGNIYRDIKVILDKGKLVFFVGTPCQVAGLHNYLRKNYENLFTADLVCHGIPSQYIFDKYLSEITNGQKIDEIIFRDKTFGWRGNAERILIKNKNKIVYDNTLKKGDPYIKGFLGNITLRKSCEDCPFSEMPRQGDITIGDFWGIEKVDKDKDDNLGTSMLFINNKKGEKIVNNYLKKEAIIKSFPYKNNLPNRLHSFFKASKHRETFFDLIQNNSFGESIKKIQDNNPLEKKYDIGLVCNYTARNFGGSLTQYALFNTLKDFGYSVLLIERPRNATEPIITGIEKQLYYKWPYKIYDICPQLLNKNEMQILNNVCDKFVVGSDVLFRTSLYKKMGEIACLDWVKNNKLKIAYAASYGYDYLVDEHDRPLLNAFNLTNAEMAYHMKNFDSFSCREKSGVKLFKDNFGVDASFVLDPVFLCDKKHYDVLIKNSKGQVPTNHICCYILDPTEDKKKIIESVSKTVKKEAIIFSEYSNEAQRPQILKIFNNFNCPNYKTEDRLKCIRDSDFVIADSFHGICFAIIYNKPFICIANAKRGKTRFDSLLESLGITSQMVLTYNEYIEKQNRIFKMNYTKINAKLNELIAASKKWLLSALNKTPKKELSTYDLFEKEIQAKDREIDSLKRKINILYSSINKLPTTNNIHDYFSEIKRVICNSIVVISVKDTPGIELTFDFAEEIRKSMGLEINLHNRHQKSYIAIIENKNVICECLDEKLITKRVVLDGFKIDVTSAGLNCGNVASIKINGENYSMNKRGINIVAIDILSKTIIDVVNIDTHLKPYILTRNTKTIG